MASMISPAMRRSGSPTDSATDTLTAENAAIHRSPRVIVKSFVAEIASSMQASYALQLVVEHRPNLQRTTLDFDVPCRGDHANTHCPDIVGRLFSLVPQRMGRAGAGTSGAVATAARRHKRAGDGQHRVDRRRAARQPDDEHAARSETAIAER